MRIIFGLLLAVAALAVPTAPTLRLPDTVVPVSYQLDLHLDPAKTTFDGRIRIQLDIKQSTDVIWLHALQLQITRATVTGANGKAVPSQLAESKEPYLGIALNRSLPAGKATLEIEYAGHVRQQDSSAIFAMEDKGSHYLYTQFESTDARAAFPCFDEPRYKVPWQVTLEVPAAETAVSNTDAVAETRHGDTKTFTFRQTKPLPSYLVAFAVGPFEFVDGGKAGKAGVPVRIVAPKGRAREAKYAASITATVITRLEKYFQIPFPYSKSDQLAIPMTGGFGAMENAGLVTYAQNILLADPDRDTESRQRLYASVAAHELAHQWFGDLVTTAWWNDIWLNEAFATWMEQKLIREWKPEWKTSLDDVRSKNLAENQDSLLSARKVRQEIVSEADIENAFDGITYEKGAAVIAMFERLIGPDKFQQGVTSYLNRYAFRNATAPEFLDAISTTSGQNITTAFSSFLNQSGVPAVAMKLDCGNGQSVLNLKQSRYVPLGIKAPEAQTWEIPVCVKTPSHTDCRVMTKPAEQWQLTGGCAAWFDGDADAAGYYRVSYSPEALDRLAGQQRQLTAAERLELLGNAFEAADSGALPVGDALALVDRWHTDPELQVVQAGLRRAISLYAHQVPAQQTANFERFLQKDFGAMAHSLGWNPKANEPPEVQLVRPDFVTALATLGNDQMLAGQAKDLASAWLSKGNESGVASSVLGGVLQTAAYYGDSRLAQAMLDRLKTTTDRQDRQKIFFALRSFRDPDAVKLAMNAYLTGQVPALEGVALLLAGQGSAATRSMGLQFVRDHFDQVLHLSAGGSFSRASILPDVGNAFCSVEEKQKLQAVFEPRLSQIPVARRTLAQVSETIDACAARTEKEQTAVSQFFRRY